MNSKISIIRKFKETVFIITTIIIVLFASISVFVKYSEYNRDCELITNTYISEQESIFKHEVENAVYDINYSLRNSGLSVENIKKLKLKYLRDIRIANRGKDMGFFFIKSYDGIQILSVSIPSIEGKDVSQYKDPDGIVTHELFMNIVNESGEGFADYSWFNPASGKNQKKRSYIKRIPELQWYIGAGFWFEDINSIINVKKANLKNDIRNYIIILFIVIFILYITLLLVLKSISDKIKNNFKKFISFFGKSATQYTFIEKENLHYHEFDKLADSANKMVLEHKQVEKELAKLSTAVTQSPAVIIITNLKGDIEYVNPKFTELTGYTFEEVKNRNSRILKSGELPDKIYKELWESISSGKQWHGEFHNKKKNGELFWEAASVSPVFDKQGKIINYLKVSEDITERKKVEEELVKYRENLEELVEKRTKELEDKNQKLKEFNELFRGREIRIKELRLRVKELEERLRIS